MIDALRAAHRLVVEQANREPEMPELPPEMVLPPVDAVPRWRLWLGPKQASERLTFGGLIDAAHALGERANAARLTPSQVLQIRQRLGAGEKRRRLAEEFHVHPDTIRDIETRKTWRNL